MTDPWRLDIPSLPVGRPARRLGNGLPRAIPRLSRNVITAAFVNELTGARRRQLYVHALDGSRYTAEKLRELRRTRR